METLKHAFCRFSLAFLLGASVSACASAAVEKRNSAPFTVEVPGDPVVEGGVFFISLTSKESLQEITGNFQGRNFSFFPDVERDELPDSTNVDKRTPATASDEGSHRYRALVGVGYGATSGKSEILIRAKHGHEYVDGKYTVTVQEGVFPSETLRVPPRTVTPSKKDQKRIARDRVAIKRAYSSSVKSRLWDPPAVLPVDSAITSVFGTSRVYNGKKQNVHLGTDLRAPTGTPLHVPLTGKVVLARNLFYTGNTVILDHGYGLFTIYGHLSKLRVKEGQFVKKGKVMGLAGATGRASGPHLHWGVHLNGAKVDPMVLVKSIN